MMDYPGVRYEPNRKVNQYRAYDIDGDARGFWVATEREALDTLHLTSSPDKPGPAPWSCCKADPQGVVSYPDGTAMIACGNCLLTVPEDRRHPLPDGFGE